MENQAQYKRTEHSRPKELKKLQIPDQIDLYMEDGTIYHVQSFFVGNAEMCDLLDALTIEAIERVK